MPTINQVKTAQKVKETIETHEALDGKDILAFVGYSKGIQKNAGVVLKKLGFSVEAADMTVAKILRTGKEENQLRASDQIYKRLGAYKDTEQGAQKTLVVLISGESANRYGVSVTQKPEDSSDRPS
jgi:glucan phosphoethanolaminetransferase (alkaline phosphatase superfamily)